MDEYVVLIADIIRWILVSMAAIIVGVTSRVLQLHYMASAKALRKGDARGILPMHVWLISSSYIILMLSTIYQNIIRIGDPPGVYLVSNGVSYTLGIVALWLILRYQKRKTNVSSLPYRRNDDTGSLPIIKDRRTD